MLSSRFLVVTLLYLVHVTRLVVADPLGGNQSCESVRTVTVVRTVTPNQPPSSSLPARNANPSPIVTQRPGGVNLGNGNNNNNRSSSVNNKNSSSKNGNTKTSSTVLPTVTPPTRISNNSNGDPSTSLTLDPSVIQHINGKAQGVGQVDSLVSPNNFINSCLGKTITNGKQILTGSCNPTPIGDLPSVDLMPSVKFQSPKNFDTIPSNTSFTIELRVNNLDTGTFTDPASTYFAAPQQLVNGTILGHSHVTVQQMSSLDSTSPLDPKVFAFFKGLNTAAINGVLSVVVTNGLAPGCYRVTSIAAASNHQEALGPIAQRGSFNDAVYFTVTDGGQNPQAQPPSSLPIDSTSSTVLPTSVSSSISSSPPVPTSTGGPQGGNGTNSKRMNRRSHLA